MEQSKPIWQRQREALRAFQTAAQARADLETTSAEDFRERAEAIETEYREAQTRFTAAYQEAVASAEKEASEAREAIAELCAAGLLAAENDMAQARRDALDEYGQGKHRAQADFKESRWTITTLYEAGRKVAKDHLQNAQTKARTLVLQLEAQKDEALRLLQKWRFANDLPLVIEPSAVIHAPDPWLALQTCASQGANTLGQLQNLVLPARLNGLIPFLVLGLVWIVGSLPALLLDDWSFWVWLLVYAAVVWPFGLLLRYYLIRRARTQVTYLWRQLGQSVVDARKLRTRCLDLARQAYRQQRMDNKKRNQDALLQAAGQTRRRMQVLRQERSRAVRRALEQSNAVSADFAAKRDEDLAACEARLQATLNQLASQHDDAVFEAGARFRSARDENNRRHAGDWTRLVSDWKRACERFQAEMRAVDELSRRQFLPWDRCLGHDWRLPDALPDGLRLGGLDIRLDNLPNAIPVGAHLARLDLTGISFPALLPFPERASLLLTAHDEGKAAAVTALQALLLRAWTSLPAGKMRCAIVDPVGRGENFSAFMHLADHDESLVTSRIWTETQQIEQRLADLTTHMEIVLQKYLRNQYKTLAEYNAEAGEVAEPFRFLVVADFPVNFTAESCRRLISLASAGARCGIYTFVMADSRQPLPQNIEMADLERACRVLRWNGERFTWPDTDFDRFPLELDKPPDAETNTRILKQVGVQAKAASRVEVPFATIVPRPDEFWRSDSRTGLSVPLGRAGATAFQELCLGRGTAQHALIAGKTGSGKSTLLHVLISQLALRYNPDEVELYLIDFKKGVEFKAYAVHELPHARVVAVESEREFGLSVLQRLDAELVRRGDRFRALGVSDLPGYRSLRDLHVKNGQKGYDHPADSVHSAGDWPAAAEGSALVPMPRIVMIVDEFQEFFVEDDKLAQEAALLLDRLVRQGRAFGVHVILGSQTLGGAYSLARTTIDQMAIRIALQCSEADAHLILSKDNGDARLLSRPGEAIYNSANGLLEGNHLFQIVWLSDQERDEVLRQIRQIGQRRQHQTNQIVFEGTAPSDLSRNVPLRSLARGLHPAPAGTLPAWLGEAVAIKDPTAAHFRRQSGSNLLFVGQDDAAAIRMMIAALVSLSAGRLPGPDESFAELVIAAPVNGESQAVLDVLGELMPLMIVPPRKLGEKLKEWVAESERRLQGEEGSPRFLFLFGLQKLRDLRRPEDEFGFGRKGEEATPHKMFLQLAREGPPLGMHLVVWCDTLTNLQRALDRQALREFEMRVLTQMSAADSSTLIDSPTASRLGMFRALFSSEDRGLLEKFRPFGLPGIDWLRQLHAEQPELAGEPNESLRQR